MKNPEKMTIQDLALLIVRMRDIGAELQVNICPIRNKEEIHGGFALPGNERSTEK